MEQKIRDTIKLTKCYSISEQFLVALDHIIYSHDSAAEVKIKVSCGDITYSFEETTEFIEFTEKMTEIIDDMRIQIRFLGENKYYYSNEIEFKFYNDPESYSSHPGEITFDFDNKNDYLVLKNQIQTLLKNYEQGTIYSFVSTVPVVVYMTVILVGILWGYAVSKGWNLMPLTICSISIEFFIIMELTYSQLPKKIKRYLFPFIEYDFGNNKKRNEKSQSIRRFVGGTVIVGFFVSLIAGFVGTFLY